MNPKKTSSMITSNDNKMLIDFFEKRFTKLETLIQNTNKSTIPDVLQPKEICKKLGWSRSKFEQFKKDKLFRTFKIGGKVYVYASDLLVLFP